MAEPRNPRTRQSIEVGLVSLSLQGLPSPNEMPGLAAYATPPAVIREAEFGWGHPLEVILRFIGKEMHEVLADAAAACEAGILWDLYVESRRLAREREHLLEAERDGSESP